ncbi:Uncharacterised protein g4846 [Pycnogonum litorale]
MESDTKEVFPLKPDVNDEDVIDLLKRFYNFDVTHVTELNSYDDRNFHFKVSNKGAEINTHGYVLKILNRRDSNTDCVDGFDKMSIHLNERVVSCPTPVPDTQGRLMSFHKFTVRNSKDCFKSGDSVEGSRECDEFLVRVLNFIPGIILHQIKLTPHILYQCGELMARMSNALSEFSHPVLNKRKTLMWSLLNVPYLRNLLHIFKNRGDVGIMNDIIDKFEVTLLNSKHLFSPGIVHNDPNEQNILVRKRNENDDVYDICGLIDFGDAHSAYTIFDLAILICYLTMQNQQTDIYETSAHCLAGYFKHRGLNKAEFDALPVLIYGRTAQSLIMGANAHSLDPDNNYLLVASVGGWKLLRAYPSYSQQIFYRSVKRVMDSYDPNNLPDYLIHN